MSKKVIVAQHHGFCGNDKFGVRASIKIAQETAAKEKKVYLLGEIVHNSHVVEKLEKQYKVKTVQQIKEIPAGSTIIIRAHGTTPQTYQQAKQKKLKIIDATCPIVRHSHLLAKRFADQGKKIIYIASNKTHDEAIGVAAESPQNIILTTLTEILDLKIDNPSNTIIMTQTTLSTLETEKVLKKIKEKYPELKIQPGICMATTKRQQEIITLAKKIGCVVIVGHPTSSNSNRLKEVAEQVGAKAYIVDTAKELKKAWFRDFDVVAVSSGASTPEWLLDDVVATIEKY